MELLTREEILGVVAQLGYTEKHVAVIRMIETQDFLYDNFGIVTLDQASEEIKKETGKTLFQLTMEVGREEAKRLVNVKAAELFRNYKNKEAK